MAIHRGEIVRKVVTQDLGVKISSLASRLNVDRNTPRNWFNKPDLEWEVIRKIGEAVDFDFSEVFPEMPFKESNNFALEDKADYGWPDECRKAVEHWKNKYLNLQEKYIEVLERLDIRPR